MPTTLPLKYVYQFIEPGPVVLLVTALPGAKPNIMAMSWHMMVEFEPPLIACIVSSSNYSFAALHETGECVLAIPDAKLAEQVTGIGNCSGRTIDKFTEFRLTPLPGQHVMPPLVSECFVNLECRVVEIRFVNKYNMFILECIKGWAIPDKITVKTIHHHGFGTFTVDGETIHTASKMP